VSLHYSLSGVRCVFCDRLVDRIHVYVNAVVTVHEPPHQPDCVFMHTAEPPTGGAIHKLPHSPASSARSIQDAA
jgi:hypothetical protein